DEGSLGLPLLKPTQRGIEGQEHRDDRRLNVPAEGYLENDSGLEHPGNRCPKLCQRPAPWAHCSVGNCIWTELVEPATGFIARETGWRFTPFGRGWLRHGVASRLP